MMKEISLMIFLFSSIVLTLLVSSIPVDMVVNNITFLDASMHINAFSYGVIFILNYFLWIVSLAFFVSAER